MDDTLNNIENDDIREVIELMIYTGRRPQEILNLDWTDINFSENTIRFTNIKDVTVNITPMNNEVLQILRRRIK